MNFLIGSGYRKNNGGFTLIEMLVVVAIIGLLSSVILTALGPARDKAKDTRIISNINQARSIAETLYVGNYDALESLPSTNIRNQNLKLLSDDITSQLPVGAVGLTIIKSTPAPARTYATFSSLNTKGGDPQNPTVQYYCVDSAGHSGIRSSAPTTSVCPLN